MAETRLALGGPYTPNIVAAATTRPLMSGQRRVRMERWHSCAIACGRKGGRVKTSAAAKQVAGPRWHKQQRCRGRQHQAVKGPSLRANSAKTRGRGGGDDGVGLGCGSGVESSSPRRSVFQTCSKTAGICALPAGDGWWMEIPTRCARRALMWRGAGSRPRTC